MSFISFAPNFIFSIAAKCRDVRADRTGPSDVLHDRQRDAEFPGAATARYSQGETECGHVFQPGQITAPNSRHCR